MTGPPSWNHTAAALMTDSAKMKRPTPSRRCSGSSSRAPWPIPRATAPMPWATASQMAATARKTVSKNLAIGPLPVRTARGAGRRLRLAAPLPPAAARGRLPRRLLLARRGSALLPGTPRSRRRGPVRRSGPASRTRRGRRTGRHVNTLGNRHSSHRDPIGRVLPHRWMPASSRACEGKAGVRRAERGHGARMRRGALVVRPKPDDFDPSPHQPHRSHAPDWPTQVLIDHGFTRGGPVLRVRSGDRAPPGCSSKRTADRPLVENFSPEADSREIPQARHLSCAARGRAVRSPARVVHGRGPRRGESRRLARLPDPR